jgi:glucose-6-phosphate-specific signal transduction histidine kinase
MAAVAGHSGAARELLPDVAGVQLPDGDGPRALLAAVLVGAVLVVGEGLGRALTVLAPLLLAGPAAERLAQAEAQVSVLAGRDRLARELHDSVGHSLSLVSIQGAARRLVPHDPAGAQEAMRATEDAARRALVDLDHVLGLLRDESADPVPPVPVPDLRDVDELVLRARAAGAQVDLRHRGRSGSCPRWCPARPTGSCRRG